MVRNGVIVTLFVVLTCQWCSSDFNVIIPEICSFANNTSQVNMTWIRDIVQTRMLNQSQGKKINIFGPEHSAQGLGEICDGSEGLLKLMGVSVDHSNPSGQMIASLAPHLCSTAATFFHLKQQRFMSWTCPQSPGIISLKAETKDVVTGVERLIKYFKWRRVGFTKSKADSSSFCEEMKAQLEQSYNQSEHVSIILLGSLEENALHGRILRENGNIDGILLCTSYSFVIKNHGNVSTAILDKWKQIPIPMVLIPESPMPPNVFVISGHNGPKFVLVTIPSLIISFESGQFGVYKAKDEKRMETIFAHLIVRSVKTWLEIEKLESSSVDVNGVHRLDGVNSEMSMSFHFSIEQYEKGRWFPLINLSSTNGNGEGQAKMENTKRHHHKNNGSGSEEWSIWVQVLIVTFAAAVLILVLICIVLYARKRFRDPIYGSGSTTRRKLSRRLRSQGPYKVLLTSKDIAFGTIALPTNNSGDHAQPGANSIRNKHQNSRSHLFGGRGSEERPDLLKGSHGGVLRKNASVSTMKVETNLTGEHRGTRYKGDLVHLKKIPSFAEPLQLKMKAMAILETLQGLRHENLAAMLGCLTEVSPGLVWEFCSRGSLSDILQQNDIKLDWAFKLSLLTDLVRGMRYLHLSMIRVHGNLNSYNCVVDARWVLKITNYGINGLLQAQGLQALERSVQELLWVAPELLRDESLRKQGTQAGDI